MVLRHDWTCPRNTLLLRFMFGVRLVKRCFGQGLFGCELLILRMPMRKLIKNESVYIWVLRLCLEVQEHLILKIHWKYSKKCNLWYNLVIFLIGRSILKLFPNIFKRFFLTGTSTFKQYRYTLRQTGKIANANRRKLSPKQEISFVKQQTRKN